MSGQFAAPRSEAVQEFDTHLARNDGLRVVASLTAGLDTLLALMVDRVATEPEGKFGVDSMILPGSILKGHVTAIVEIELYQTVESAEAAQKNGYLRGQDDWYLRWLAQSRLHERWNEPGVVARLAVYRAKSDDRRRLALETALERALPQASNVPLVLYRLFPLAVEIATAIAFADSKSAVVARKRQLDILPTLADCHDCRGRLMDNGEQCPQCANPLWKFEWLTAE
jgi:hypothetical protein